MKKLYSLLTALVLTIAAGAQTLNVTLGNVTYQFPASQTGEMTYADGQTLTIMGKTFTLSDITSMTVDNSEVKANQVAVNSSQDRPPTANWRFPVPTNAPFRWPDLR